MKGVELPINTIIIVIIALIVLLAIIALFTGVWSPGTQTVTLETAKSSACQRLVSTGCSFDTNQMTISNFDANRDGTINAGIGWDWDTKTGDDNLAALCYNYYSVASDDACKQICGCQT